jgi:hypothetical protein
VPTGAPRGFYDAANKLAPRFGFSYAPGNDGKTSIRGGFGMFYDKVEGNLIFSQVNVPPFLNTPQFENGNIANASGGTPSALAPFGTINAINPDLGISYSMNFSLGVQRELPRGFFAENYVKTGSTSHSSTRLECSPVRQTCGECGIACSTTGIGERTATVQRFYFHRIPSIGCKFELQRPPVIHSQAQGQFGNDGFVYLVQDTD